jgi:hypothetical protein
MNNTPITSPTNTALVAKTVDPDLPGSAIETHVPLSAPSILNYPQESQATPLFILLDGVIRDNMWQQGWIRPQWVRDALHAVDWSSAADGGWTPDELLAAKLHHQKLLVQLSSVVNEISTNFPTDLVFDNLEQTIRTIGNWTRQEKFTPNYR